MVHKADAVSLLGVDGGAGEDQLLGPAPADEAGQALGAAKAGDDAEARLRLAELGLLRGDPDVAGHGQLAAAAESVAVDGGDGGLGHLLQDPEGLVPQLREGTARRGVRAVHLGDVRPGHEGLLPPAGEDHHPDVLALPDLPEAGVELVEGLGIQGVQGLGPVDGDGGDGVRRLKAYIVHGKASQERV